MKCSDAHKLMGDYLEGVLAPEEGGKLRDHLESCEDCKELLEDFDDIAQQARELPRLEPSDAAWPAILRRVRKARTETAAPLAPRRRWFETIFAPGRFVAAGVAVLLFMAVVGGIVFTRRPANRIASLSEQDRFTLAKVEEAEKYYKLAIRALSEAVGCVNGDLRCIGGNLRFLEQILHGDTGIFGKVVAGFRRIHQHEL